MSFSVPFRDFLCECLHAFPVEPGIKKPENVAGSDQILHVPILAYYASKCHSIVEFGCRDGISTAAFLSACPGTVYSVDIEISSRVAWLRQRKNAGELPTSWVFIEGNTENPYLGVPHCDFLFVDDLHTGPHLTKELNLHGRKAKKYLGFHDTQSCAIRDVSGNNPDEKGIWQALQDWLAQFPGEYIEVYRTPYNNGLAIYERVAPKSKRPAAIIEPFYELNQQWWVESP